MKKILLAMFIPALLSLFAGSAFADYLNMNPVSDAGGDYFLYSGYDLVLDGSGSADPNEGQGDYITSYAWDIDGDGLYDDYFGEVVTIPYAEWSTYWAEIPGTTHIVSLVVTDSNGARSLNADTTATFVPGSPPSTTPIPGAIWLLGTGVLGLFGLRRKLRD